MPAQRETQRVVGPTNKISGRRFVRHAACPHLLFVFLLAFCASGLAQKVSVRFIAQSVIEDRPSLHSRDNQKRKEALVKLFQQAAGNSAQVREEPVDGTKLPNVLCSLEGQSERVIVVGGHYDANFSFHAIRSGKHTSDHGPFPHSGKSLRFAQPEGPSRGDSPPGILRFLSSGCSFPRGPGHQPGQGRPSLIRSP